jgi:hypothetical protein
MSFDLKISNRELVIGANGDIQTVVDSEKLVQDILKIALTQLGANPFFPWYGSPLSSSSIGTVLDYQMIASINSDQLRQCLQKIQTMQAEQVQQGQTLSAAEQLAAIRSVTIMRNVSDPTVYKVSIEAYSRALTPLSTSFDIAL